MMNDKLTIFFSKILGLINKNRSLASLFFVFFVVLGTDFTFHYFYSDIVLLLDKLFGLGKETHDAIDLTFAPEIWGGVLATVLGTLIIVIAIAAESTPKLMDLFVKDWVSLIFIWFLILASIHATVIMYYFGPMERLSSVMLNTYVYLPASSMLSLPYIFYILLYSKTDNVIKKLYTLNIEDINRLKNKSVHLSMDDIKNVEHYQYQLMSTIDQFDDLLEYISFKEAQTEIIRRVGDTVRAYMRNKSFYDSRFFAATDTIRNNPTFRTYVEHQYKDLEERKTFYEVKAFKMMGNAYIRKMENGEYELASLIASEVSSIGLLALDLKQHSLIVDINIRFNTFMRFAIKHAVRNNEPRNLYNLAFHYSALLKGYVDHNKEDLLKQSYFYFKFYSNEIYKQAAKNPSLYFIVDVLTAELKKITILISEETWDNQLQEHLLKEILQLDNPPDYSKEELDQSVNNGVRVLQIGLALHFIKINNINFAETIVSDVLDDLAFFDNQTYLKLMEGLYNRIRFSGPTFWEDTDRGNTNIYYTPDSDKIDDFKKILSKQMKGRLEKLDRDVQFLRLELDKLNSKKDQTAIEKEKIVDLESKINTRRKTFFKS
ncbi:hypothetical protein HOA87_00305 [bacterium]|jgi:hypothetical protein|nr:hypothetical protein [bacterium]MBT4248972.1 hypothetical protein [bacterium]MBT4926820.1 hypothetical protein [bacterium]MBT6018888.1 hypothetical protein [bacterium]MBT6776405.1 hypothetical protein [bacterium]